MKKVNVWTRVSLTTDRDLQEKKICNHCFADLLFFEVMSPGAKNILYFLISF